ncbi:YhcN/YlaJ family sporulation lipoprotein [Paenibacillus sp. KQZ6P-2]|uniref:YhcN/YlaJ family sporulation lipoprotein n=1 Tax=Paenibacillus mangrovi TaxID=2931978 RepID=A0A9X1WR90_9BACL|nr:YhcN/YlaJ family sporulation lipoprotein [Paenibacillus mangrovi]MCJ8013882.1 YhcN/YlaJ family sporulation lipoprotein [Paenibacillus mangrovi]
MMRSKAITLSVSAALLASMATGCGTPANTNVSTKNVNTKGYGTTGQINVNSLNGKVSTYNTDGTKQNVNNLTSAQHLADKVAALKEVRTANVLRSGNNAYVAVTLESPTTGQTGTKGTGTTGTTSTTSTTGNYGITSTNKNYRTSSFGTTNNSSFNNYSTSTTPTSKNNPALYGTMGTGSYGVMRGVTGTGTTGTPTTPSTYTGMSTSNVNHMHGYTTSSGEPITKSNGYNATTPGTAGTNETLSQHNAQYNVSADIKNKISDVIKKADPSVTNVYVSANPDVVQHVNNYVAEVKKGNPVGGAVNELSSMFNRMVPAPAGTTTNTYTPSTYNTNNRVTPMGTTPTAPIGKTPAPKHPMQ